MTDARRRADPALAAVRLGRLADAVGYRLRLAQDASFGAFSRLAGDVGLRPGLYALLHLIGENPGVTQTAVSRALGRDKSTLTPILVDAERRGLVRREADPADRRGRRLTLTPAGAGKLQTLAACADRHEARLDAILGPDGKTRFLALLERVTSHIEAGAGCPEAGRNEER